MSIGKETKSGDVENYSLKILERYFTPMARETHHKIETSEILLTEDIVKMSSQLAGLWHLTRQKYAMIGARLRC